MTDLSPRAERVLELARHADDPDPGRAERIERSLSKRIALGAAIAGGGAAVSNSALGAGVVAAVKATVALGVATTLALTGWKALDARGGGAATAIPTSSAQAPRVAMSSQASRAVRSAIVRSPSAIDTASAPASPAEGALVGNAQRADKLSGGPGRAPRAVASVGRPPVADAAAPASQDLLAMEARELRLAQRALRAGESNRALALLAAQDARHSSGALAQERHAARVLALCQSGQVSLARREASSFESRFPRSPLVAKVRGACRGQ